MKRTAVALLLLVFAACASTPTPPPALPPVVTPVAPPLSPARSANAMTPVAAVAKTIAEPRIRVGIVSDQAAVTFPR
ncbi:MAG TPA: peptidase inhibitor I78, partial [Thermoanaerobaculia bacterium]